MQTKCWSLEPLQDTRASVSVPRQGHVPTYPTNPRVTGPRDPLSTPFGPRSSRCEASGPKGEIRIPASTECAVLNLYRHSALIEDPLPLQTTTQSSYTTAVLSATLLCRSTLSDQISSGLKLHAPKVLGAHLPHSSTVFG